MRISTYIVRMAMMMTTVNILDRSNFSPKTRPLIIIIWVSPIGVTIGVSYCSAEQQRDDNILHNLLI